MSLIAGKSIKRSTVPFTYLGVPLFVGAPRRIFLQPIADRILGKFSAWKGASLSMAGRVSLVTSVIQSSMLHSFAIYKWPKQLLRKLNQ